MPGIVRTPHAVAYVSDIPGCAALLPHAPTRVQIFGFERATLSWVVAHWPDAHASMVIHSTPSQAALVVRATWEMPEHGVLLHGRSLPHDAAAPYLEATPPTAQAIEATPLLRVRRTRPRTLAA